MFLFQSYVYCLPGKNVISQIINCVYTQWPPGTKFNAAGWLFLQNILMLITKPKDS